MMDIAMQTLGAAKVAKDLAVGGSEEPAMVLPVRLAGSGSTAI
jgi:hypothetical protein